MTHPPSESLEPETPPAGADFAQVESGVEAQAEAGVVSPEVVTIAGLQAELARVQAELQSTRDELAAARTANEELSQANEILLERLLVEAAIKRYLTWQVNHDHLTSLMTEEAFKGALAAEIEAYPDVPRGFFEIDLGNFKVINDEYGHDLGNEVIKFIAAQLSRGEGKDGRRPDLLARRSKAGDEFVGVIDATPSTPDDAAPDEHAPRTPHDVMKFQVLRLRALRTAVLEQFPQLRTMKPEFYIGVTAIIYNPSATYEDNFTKVDLALLAQKVKDQETYGSAPGRAVSKPASRVPAQASRRRPKLLSSQQPRLAAPRALRKKPNRPS